MVKATVSKTLDHSKPRAQKNPWNLTKNWFDVGTAIASVDRFREAFPPRLTVPSISETLEVHARCKKTKKSTEESGRSSQRSPPCQY